MPQLPDDARGLRVASWNVTSLAMAAPYLDGVLACCDVLCYPYSRRLTIASACPLSACLPTCSDHDGATPVHVAASHGHAGVTASGVTRRINRANVPTGIPVRPSNTVALRRWRKMASALVCPSRSR